MSKHDVQARPIYHHERDPIEAHLTITAADPLLQDLRDPLDRTHRHSSAH